MTLDWSSPRAVQQQHGKGGVRVPMSSLWAAENRELWGLDHVIYSESGGPGMCFAEKGHGESMTYWENICLFVITWESREEWSQWWGSCHLPSLTNLSKWMGPSWGLSSLGCGRKKSESEETSGWQEGGRGEQVNEGTQCFKWNRGIIYSGGNGIRLRNAPMRRVESSVLTSGVRRLVCEMWSGDPSGQLHSRRNIGVRTEHLAKTLHCSCLPLAN